jgi:type IV fimbrial biogenesis protein FimT
VSSLHAARNEALTRSRSVTLCASRNWNAEQPACDNSVALLAGWIMFVDSNNNGALDDDEDLLQANGPLHETILNAPQTGVDQNTPQYLSFRADGLLQDIPGLGPGIGNVQLCDARGNRDIGGGRSAGRWISLSPAGRPTLIDRVARLQDSHNPLGGC